MCGIVGYIGSRDAARLIMEGLQRLEYRGYDSAGIAVIQDEAIHLRRDVGKLTNLRARLADSPIQGHIGIGHTRWATHGIPAEHNAHPHISMDGQFVVVHNGIVENYRQLRAELIAQGVEFKSDTDTEVIVHLVAQVANSSGCDITEATRAAVSRLKGAHAIVVMSSQQQDRLVAVRIGNAGGVVVGLGEGENYVASDIPAILEYTRRVIFLDNLEMATITADGYHIETLDGTPSDSEIHHIAYDPVSAAKGTFKHFMLKEIFDQPRSITDTIRGRVDFEHGEIHLPETHLTADKARALQRLIISACGTSYYSGSIGKFYIEHMARLNVEVDYSSEYRYRNPIIDDQSAILAITQSGETVDTLVAMEEARGQGAFVLAIVNAIGSQATRIADGVITMNAGPEIGVASTKAFTTSVVDQYLLAIYLGQLRQTLTPERQKQYIQDTARLPNLIGQTLEQEAQIGKLSEHFYHYSDFLFLGRGVNYPVALEGALKLKELSYIHAEGYPAGEMKHGPIALVDDQMPVIAIALQDSLYDKMLSQIEQVKARHAPVIAIATEGDTHIASKADHVIFIPEAPALLNPILAVLPLQLFAYHIALRRGADIDQPRNLAKSVTVE